MIDLIRFQIPSKTFILGEYSVLKYGCALMLAHSPYFYVEFRRSSIEKSPFHKDSPAGIWVSDNAEDFKNFEIQFINPEGFELGGLGASTAEFIAVNLFSKFRSKINLDEMSLDNPNSSPDFFLSKLNPWEILEDYLKLFTGDSPSPSGADLLVQLTGGIVYIDKTRKILQRLPYPFKEELRLFHTGEKVKTHSHLSNLASAVDYRDLQEYLLQGQSAIYGNEAGLFAQAVNNYAAELFKLGLTAGHSQSALKHFSGSVLASKGCGALGADVILTYGGTVPSLTGWKLKPIVSLNSLSLTAELKLDFAAGKS